MLNRKPTVCMSVFGLPALKAVEFFYALFVALSFLAVTVPERSDGLRICHPARAKRRFAHLNLKNINMAQSNAEGSKQNVTLSP